MNKRGTIPETTIICPQCQQPFVTTIAAKKFCNNRCATKYWKLNTTHYCECSNLAVRRYCGGWCCAKCIEIEQRRDAWEEEASARRKANLHHNTLEELGWKRFIDKWTAEERRIAGIVRRRFNPGPCGGMA